MIAPGRDVRRELKLPEDVRCYAVAGTRTCAPARKLASDGLVPVDSALGRHRDPALTLAFTDTWIGFGMGHVELLAERILFLKGEVEMVTSAEVQKIHDVRAMLELARQMEEGSVRDYNLWANECAANADSVSKKIFEALVEDEERHFDQYDIEMENIDKFGDRYLALQSIERSKSISAGVAGD